MQVPVSDPILQTFIFSVVFFILLLGSVKKLSNTIFFSSRLTDELKGFAILTIIFSHIGYFLSSTDRFLYPLSILAGVGVNLFLFLSGFGLAVSSLKSDVSILAFYKKRLKKLFVPLWIVISLFLLIDSFVLLKSYPILEIVQGYLGFYPKADIWLNLDSPLWYFSMIFFYYLIFPLTFLRKFTYLSPIILLFVAFIFLKLPLPLNIDVLNLYKLHFASFPLGVMFALLVPKLEKHLQKPNLKFFLIPLFLLIALYTSVNSGVGLDKTIEQIISLIVMFSIIFIFILKNFEFRLFYFFGRFSYIIYLIHWPILSRYDIFYKIFPAFLATIFYLIFFLGIGYLFSSKNEVDTSKLV